jgi:hypothetical protein
MLQKHPSILNELGIPTNNRSDLDLPCTKKCGANYPPVKLQRQTASPEDFTRFASRYIIKHDTMVVISAVWSRKMMGFSALNTACITLHPKKGDAQQHISRLITSIGVP